MSREDPKSPARPKRRAPALGNVVPLRPAAARPPAQARKPRKRPARALPPVDAAEAERALAQMARQLTAASAPTEALKLQLQVVHALLGAKASYVARLDASRGRLQVESVRGRYDERITAASPEEGLVGRAFAVGAVLREEDELAVPLEGAQGRQGCLAVLSPRRHASDDLLLALAAQLAATYEVARLRDDAARRNKDLQTAIAGLKSLEQNRDDLLGNVSHDLKNPLTTIKTYLAMLGREKLGPVTDGQRKALQTCDRNADRMLRMVSDLLLISRLQSGKMELHERPFGLKALADEAVRLSAPLSEQTRVRLRVAPSPEVFVRGDRERILEAVQNLVESCAHHSEAGQEVELRVSTDGGLASLSVRDDGPGLPREELEHLFDAFYRPPPGTPRPASAGLGLPLVSKVMALHGGRVEAQSALGAGTTFQLWLPMFAGALAAAPELDPSVPRAGGILLVEDDDDCREVLKEVLEQEGYRVMATRSASEARSILSHIRPALVLLDLRLSEEDGRSVLRFVRGTEGLADVAVYIVSGASEVASLTAGQGLDRIDGFFEKPLPLPKLLDTVAAVVRPSRRGVAGP